MIIEQASLRIKTGAEDEFITSLQQALPIIERAKGLISYQMIRNIENPHLFIFIVRWETLEDHIEHFVKSEDFKKWNAAIVPYFAGEPEVLHFDEII
ncbi:antibiotic biosynthesis monooxygenase [Bacillus sp. FJAT-42376]|nr:antibiotic biosynthesis monooxygenase [Bacillus sp. FJAT-42376]